MRAQAPTPTSATAARYPAQITPLLGLQFIALAWVVLNQFRFHLDLHAGDRSGLVFKGYLGAELFFVTTGFVTAHAYLQAKARGAFSFGGFLWARLIRVYPLHLAMIALIAALFAAAGAAGVSHQHGVGGLRGLMSNLLMVQAWGVEPTVSWNFPSWLISAEWFAYIAFPLTAWLAFKACRGPLSAIVAPIVLFTVLFETAQTRGILFSDMTAQIGALQTVPAFLLGAGLYRLGAARDLPAGGGRVVAGLASVWILAGALLRVSDIMLFPAFGALVFGLAETVKSGRPALSGPAAQYLGRIAYAVYLVYLPVDIVYFHAIARVFGQPAGALAWAAWAGVFPVILLAGALAHQLVARPAEVWLASRLGRRPARPEVAAAA